jgi:hypothetical protein
MKRAHREYLRLGIGGVIVAALVTGCFLTNLRTTQVAILPPAQIFPRDSLCNPNDQQLAAERGYDNATVQFARANGYDGWCIPEYDDDQRLSDGNLPGKDYGAVAHVLAAPWLDTLQLTTEFRQVAILALDPESTPATFPYTQLQLGTGGRFNCIYLRHQNAADTSFDAMIVPPAGLKCPGAATGGTVLVVGVEQKFGTAWENYPPTTRFIEEGTGRTIIGIKCSNHWCGIRPVGNPPGFDVALASTSSGGGPLPAAPQDPDPLYNFPQARIKGWFDDQYLGVPDGSPNHKIHRQVRAVAIPAKNLGALTFSDFVPPIPDPTRYTDVGVVLFPEAPPPQGSKYVKYFGFGPGLNKVAMRGELQNGGTDTVWFTRVISNNGRDTMPNIRTRRMDHNKWFHAVYDERTQIPATARFRWLDDDEDLWYECLGGCCLAGKN